MKVVLCIIALTFPQHILSNILIRFTFKRSKEVFVIRGTVQYPSSRVCLCLEYQQETRFYLLENL